MADELSPDDLMTVRPQGVPTFTIRPRTKEFLNEIASGEAPDYNTIYGGRKVEDLSQHPRIAVPITSGPNVGKTSSAAGRYQFIGPTWDKAAKALGLTDFTPASQDKAAAWLAQTTYERKTGRDLEEDLASKDPKLHAGIRQALAGEWESFGKAGPRADKALALGNSKYRFNDELYKGDNTHLMSPEDYLALSPPMDNSPSAVKQWRDLRLSVGKGEPIHTAPTLDMAVNGPTGTITAQDGRNRALLAQEAGVEAIPVQINKTGEGTPTEIKGMSGNVVPADRFTPGSQVKVENQGGSIIGRMLGIGSAHAAEPTNEEWFPVSQPMAAAGGDDEEWSPVAAPGALPPDKYADWDITTSELKARQQSRQADAAVPLREDPNKTYGTVLPYARDNTTGALEWAVPGLLRSPIRGAVEGGQQALGQRPVGDPRTAGDVFGAATFGGGIAPGSRAIPGGAAEPLRVMTGAPAPDKAFQEVYRFVEAIAGKDIGSDPAALKIVNRMASSMKAGGPTATDMIEALNAAKGKPLTLADLGDENLLALAGKVARTPGASRQIMTQFLNERDEGAGTRLAGDVDKGIGSGSAYDAGAALNKFRATAAAPLYEKAWNALVTMAQVRPIQRYIQDRIGQQALEHGMRIQEIESLGVGSAKHFDPEKFGVVRGQSGAWIIDPDVLAGKKAPSMRLLDAVKRGYDQIVESYRSDTTGKLNLNEEGRAINNARADYVKYLRDTFPDYGKALDAWGGPSQSLDALKAGQQFLRQRPEEISRRMATLGEGDKEFYKLGAADTLRTALAKKGVEGDEAKAIIKSQYMRDQLRPLFDNDAAYDKFIKAVEAEGTMFGTRRQVLGNSATAARLAEDTTPEAAAFSHAVRGGLHAAHGNMLGLLRSGVDSGMALLRLRDPQINADIARFMTQNLSGEGVSSRMNALKDMMRAMPATRNYLTRGGPSLAAPSGAPGSVLSPLGSMNNNGPAGGP